MLLKIYPENPNPKHIRMVVDCLKQGGIIIFPTDTIYAIGCDLSNNKAIEKLCSFKGVKPENANPSFIFYDLSHISDFTTPISNPVFKIIKRTLPGPYTYILSANNNIPKVFKNRKKTIGIRIPDNSIVRSIVLENQSPLLSMSVHDDDEILEYSTDPELIYEKYRKKVDMVIDGGYGGNEPSTVIDCTGEEPAVLRLGKGPVDFLG